MDGFEELINAIIVRAVKDYRYVLKKCIRYPYSKEWQTEKRKLEQFFHSAWYKALTNLDSEILIRKIKEELGYDSKRIFKAKLST